MSRKVYVDVKVQLIINADDGVEISDEKNAVKLSSGEWDLLVKKIKNGEI